MCQAQLNAMFYSMTAMIDITIYGFLSSSFTFFHLLRISVNDINQLHLQWNNTCEFWWTTVRGK